MFKKNKNKTFFSVSLSLPSVSVLNDWHCYFFLILTLSIRILSRFIEIFKLLTTFLFARKKKIPAKKKKKESFFFLFHFFCKKKKKTFSSMAAPNTEHWIPDDQVKACESCGKKFGMFNRKQHCRFCGHIFCNKCTKTKIDLPEEMGYDGPQKVCEPCIPTIQGRRRAKGHADRAAIVQQQQKADTGVEDMTMLTSISNDSIALNMKKRYDHDLIYTYIGHVLISVNPFTMIKGLYSTDTLFDYRGKYAYELPPHVYMVAETMYRSMQADNESQCVIISGESGAGKTEAAKKVMQYVAAVSGKGSDVDRVKDVILQSNPLLEAFGNAKTVRNDNSSRFGKYMEILFDRIGDPQGGQISNYLLEKSRVVTRHRGERSFHIFYQLLVGLTNDMASAYGIGGALTPDMFHYLSLSECYAVDTINDTQEFNDTVEAMQVMGFTKEEQTETFRLILAVLFLGNLQFVENDKEASSVANADALASFCHLMAVDEGLAAAALTTRIMTSGSSRASVYNVPNTKVNAEYARDALSKAAYSRLFDYIVKRVNDNLYTDKPDLTTLGVLDIYGFEIFETNGFEQLCINYVNEMLQQIFINLTLKEEQEEYAREQIPWTPIDFFNNKVVCELIEGKRPPGVFALLDDTCNFPKGTDEKFVQKMGQQIQHEHLVCGGDGFTVKHYAGDVTYYMWGFCDKNKDVLNNDLIGLAQMSASGFIASMFPEDVSAKQSKRPTTSAFKIKSSIGLLTQALSKCHPHYVRCLKPNEKKAARTWDDKLCNHQVRYLGLLENVKVRRAGYAFRGSYQRFFYRYRVCSPQTWPNWSGDERAGSELILKELVTDSSEYAYGTTKVFIRKPETVFALEESRERKTFEYALRIQSFFKQHIGRQHYIYALQMQGLKVVQGQKERRRVSLERPYTQDYIDYMSNSVLKSICERFGDEKFLFADNCFSYNARQSRHRRIIVATDAAIYILGCVEKKSRDPNNPVPPDTYRYGLFRRLTFGEIQSVSASALADNFVCFHGVPPNSDYVISCSRKTELLGHLANANGPRLAFSNSWTITLLEKKKSRQFQLNFTKGGGDGATIANWTVSVAAGEAAGTQPNITAPPRREIVYNTTSSGAASSGMGRASSAPRGRGGAASSGGTAPRGGGFAPPQRGGMPRGGGGMARGGGGAPRGGGGAPRGGGGAPRGGGGAPRGGGGAPRGGGGMARGGGGRGRGGPGRGGRGRGGPGRGGPGRGGPGRGRGGGGGGPPAPSHPTATCMWDFTGENSDELSFKAGDVLSILDKSDPDWFKCELRGAVGVVPANYLQL
jgi:myosin I